MNTVQMTVTPEIAAKWLEKNDRNRKVTLNRVKDYADFMLAGKWELTHQGIAISEDGELIDGQHRLLAVVKANIPVRMTVTFGAIASEFIDTAKTRTSSDRSVLAGICTRKDIEANATLHGFVRFIDQMINGARHATSMTSSQIVNIIRAYKPYIETAFEMVCKLRRTSGARNSSVFTVVFLALLNGEDQEVVAEWISILGSGLYDECKLRSTNSGKSVAKFRNYVNTVKCGQAIAKKVDLMKRSYSSLVNFINNKEVDRIYPCSMKWNLPEDWTLVMN